MDKIFEYSEDLHVRSKIAYVNSTELWGAADYPVPISKTEITDTFKKGMLIIQTSAGAYATPNSIAANGAVTVGSSTYTPREETVAVAAENQATTIYSTLVSAMQASDVTVANGAITGTIKYLDDGGEIAGWWGAGNFLALKFTVPTGTESVKVGLIPHWDENIPGLADNDDGLVELVGDPDMNGIFKITDKTKQKLKLIIKKGAYKVVQLYDLSGLTCNGPSD